MSEIVDKFKEAIHTSFQIGAKDGTIRLDENNKSAKNRGFRIGANLRHLAFSLDRRRPKGDVHPVFTVINPSCPGICSVADAIIICEDIDSKDNPIAFVVELKSGHLGNAIKQVRSSKVFLDWLVELFKIHHTYRGTVKVFGLVVSARKTPAKGTTRVKKLEFHVRGKKPASIHVAEWDHSLPLHLSQMVVAAQNC